MDDNFGTERQLRKPAETVARRIVRSFTIGFVGLAHATKCEQNMQIHCVAGVIVLLTGVVCALAIWEWVVVVLCIGLVISAECMNTAIERLADRVCRDDDPLIKQAKDCSAAAVLAIVLTTTVVGGLLFIPRLCTAAGW